MTAMNILSPRVKFIASAVFIVVALAAVIIGLTLGLRTPALPNGGSPTGPPDTGGDATSAQPTDSSMVTDSASGTYRYAAVQTDTDICSKIGTYVIVELGGGAVDAAIASILCMGVVNAHSCGIGGGFFMTVYQAPRGSDKKEVSTLLSREVAPLAATQDMYVNRTDDAKYGGLAVAVPGEIAGLYKAWEIYGRVDWKDLVLPTAEILDGGFVVEEALASAIKSKKTLIEGYPSLKEILFDEDGNPLDLGDMFIDKKLAATFRKIAEDPMSFYNGSLADDIVADIQEAGGIVTKEDLSLYEPRIRPAMVAPLPNLNLTLYTPTLPSSGVVLQYILQLVDGMDFSEISVHDADSEALAYHQWAEILKFAYAKRSALGDEEFVDVSEVKANMTSHDYIQYILSRVNNTHTQDVPYYGPSFEFSNHGTAHMSVVAPDGSTVALTSTINLYFGSLVRGSRTGIIFNDEMDDFSTPGSVNDFGVPASPSNYIEPRKMPMSSMAPAIIIDSEGKMNFVSGASGGTRITSAIAYVALQNLYFKRSLKDSTDIARIHHQLVPNVLEYEEGLSEEVLSGLRARGHELKLNRAIARVGSLADTCDKPCVGGDCYTQTCLVAVADGRKGGSPDGI